MELIEYLTDSLYVIRQVKDSNIRESTGFAYNQDLYLHPEEAWYLVNKQLASSDFQIESRSDCDAFYSHMRREGLFLTRAARYNELKEHLKTIDREPEEQQSFKRFKKSQEEKKVGENSEFFIDYEIYKERRAFNQKQGGELRVALWIGGENVDLERLR